MDTDVAGSNPSKPNTLYGFGWPEGSNYACAYRMRLPPDTHWSDIKVEFFSCKQEAGARYLHLLNEAKMKNADLKIQRYEVNKGPKCHDDFDIV